MKGIFFLIVFGFGLFGLSGCYTVPRHYTQQVEIIYYIPVEPPYTPEPIIDYPPPPQSPLVNYPLPNEINQPRDRQPEKPHDSYHQRDPLQGGNDRRGSEPKTDPPVRNPEQKDRGHE